MNAPGALMRWWIGFLVMLVAMAIAVTFHLLPHSPDVWKWAFFSGACFAYGAIVGRWQERAL